MTWPPLLSRSLPPGPCKTVKRAESHPRSLPVSLYLSAWASLDLPGTHVLICVMWMIIAIYWIALVIEWFDLTWRPSSPASRQWSVSRRPILPATWPHSYTAAPLPSPWLHALLCFGVMLKPGSFFQSQSHLKSFMASDSQVSVQDAVSLLPRLGVTLCLILLWPLGTFLWWSRPRHVLCALPVPTITIFNRDRNREVNVKFCVNPCNKEQNQANSLLKVRRHLIRNCLENMSMVFNSIYCFVFNSRWRMKLYKGMLLF